MTGSAAAELVAALSSAATPPFPWRLQEQPGRPPAVDLPMDVGCFATLTCDHRIWWLDMGGRAGRLKRTPVADAGASAADIMRSAVQLLHRAGVAFLSRRDERSAREFAALMIRVSKSLYWPTWTPLALSLLVPSARSGGMLPELLATAMSIRIDSLEPEHAAVLRDLRYSLLVETELGFVPPTARESRDEPPPSARGTLR